MTQKNVLVINCGSSSFKFAVINSDTKEQIISGLAERLNEQQAQMTYKFNGEKHNIETDAFADHQTAINNLVDELNQLQLTDTIAVVGHRVVHGGETFTESVLINDDVITAIQSVSELAPLHNPANLVGINAATNAFNNIPQVAVFDTAFHQSMPKHAYLYAIDYELYQNLGLRKYGFHGTSHYFVANQAAQTLQQDINQTSLITVHLGNGCSICAVENGQSVDTSLGLTPVEGLVMGTRSGDVDPGLIVYLQKQQGYSTEDIDNLLNKKSGLLGVSKLSNDCRTLEEAAEDINHPNHTAAKLALDIFCYRAAKYVASYTCALSKLDAIVFTGGIGENSSYIRRNICQRLGLIGVNIDADKNLETRFGKQGAIESTQSNIQVLVIPTNEEWVIAQDAARLTQQGV